MPYIPRSAQKNLPERLTDPASWLTVPLGLCTKRVDKIIKVYKVGKGEKRMRTFILLALAGLGAQLVDGSLGMAYGVSSTTLLLFVGIAPAVASASVHIAEIGTTAVSGISHSSFGNVDWSKIVWLAVPGGIGALSGALVLVWASSLEATAAYVEPAVAVFLFVLGI